ncbi:AAA family ATPase [Streptomyces sp. NBC_01433]|uniref:AAA family ATPase n=1 Tax=Streptomyces sp. NBC_01433 TaxID=2903864 RepID=UPI00338D9EF7
MGASGSGKSTLARAMASSAADVVVVSYDAHQERLTGRRGEPRGRPSAGVRAGGGLVLRVLLAVRLERQARRDWPIPVANVTRQDMAIAAALPELAQEGHPRVIQLSAPWPPTDL